ncbi:MAG: hypothetical protein AB7I19_11190 [Planctomycetota bacterium]
MILDAVVRISPRVLGHQVGPLDPEWSELGLRTSIEGKARSVIPDWPLALE